jgi:hypothetical protein
MATSEGGSKGPTAPSDTPEAHADAKVEKAPDDSSKLKTFLGILRRFDRLPPSLESFRCGHLKR